MGSMVSQENSDFDYKQNMENLPGDKVQVNKDSLNKLKDSTKKLICLLEEIQSKTFSKNTVSDDFPNLREQFEPLIMQSTACVANTASEIIGFGALKRLENQAKALDAINVNDEDDDCSVFKRLTRKCVCLNQEEYNDFVIHFNEDTKYFTSTIGEIVKNLRILKKFLYMGGNYCKNALMFLNKGLSDAKHTEKVAVAQGCGYADICNVFEEYSVVITCISWPCKYEYSGDSETQALAAGLLNKIAQLEEGRRYLNFTSKIIIDMKKVLRKKAASLEFETVESLNSTLNLLQPPMSQTVDVTYYYKPIDEGYGNKAVKALLQYRKYMTLDEIFIHLDLLHNMSQQAMRRAELTSHLPTLFILFKQMLMEYDHTDMNILITNILNNIVSKNIICMENEVKSSKTMIVANTGTEAIKMKNESLQIPPVKKFNTKNKHTNKSKILTGVTSKNRQASKRKVSEWESPRTINRSKKFTKVSETMIVVPLEDETMHYLK